MPAALLIQLHISRDEFLKLYSGAARSVNATATDGRRVQFPARILQPFVTHNGIKGLFRISYDNGGRFESIVRVH